MKHYSKFQFSNAHTVRLYKNKVFISVKKFLLGFRLKTEIFKNKNRSF